MIIISVVLLILFGALNYYVAKRTCQCIGFIFPKMRPGVYITVFMLISFMMFFCGFARSMFPVSAQIKRILGTLSAYWMGFFVYLFLYCLAADIVLLICRILKAIPRPVPNNIRFISGAIVIVLTLATTCYGVYHANQVRSVSYDIQLERKTLDSEVNIVLVSDLHLGAVNSEKRIENIVKKINDSKPDIVCIAGDIFDNDYNAIHKPAGVIETLKKIKTTYGVYACLGNHDSGGNVGEMFDFLESANVKLLKDEYTVIDERLILAGRLDGSPIGGYGDMSRKGFGEIMAGADKELPIIVMDHNPAHIKEYGNEIDLILCGHTHKGQIFPGGLFTRALYIVDYGMYQNADTGTHVIVTSGAGTWGMPMRVGTDCEVVSIKLH